jgi:hypothetical protein
MECDTGQQVAIEPACFICLESDPPPVRSGCACRSDSGRAHLACLIKYAVTKHAERGIKPWVSCQICKHAFTGPTRLALGEAWWSRVCLEAEEDSERLLAAQNLSSCCLDAARYADAENLSRELYAVTRRVLGIYHRQTMASAYNLASALSFQGKLADAVPLHRRWHQVRRRLLGEDHPDTIKSAWLLASFWAVQEDFASASDLYHQVYNAAKRVHGKHAPMTLRAASTYGLALADQGRHAESEQVLRELLPIQTRVLGIEHPDVHLTELAIERVEWGMSGAPRAATVGQLDHALRSQWRSCAESRLGRSA